jgi:ADP-dependent NAD(P)H-hydrate dehydratase / NAD(P)H-hydrate epimerase
MIPLLNPDSLKEVDAGTMSIQKILSVDLMEKAGTLCALALIKIIPESKPVFVFCGSGNNGGDGLVIARILFEKGYDVNVFTLKTGKNMSIDFQRNLDRWKALGKLENKLVSTDDIPVLDKNSIVIDAIFGIGLTRIPDGIILETIKEINKNAGFIVAVDLPSGLMVDSSCKDVIENVIHANITLSIGLPKLCFLLTENDVCTGSVIPIDIGLEQDAIDKCKTNNHLVDLGHMRTSLQPRKKSAHKGSFGHALLMAGSYGKAGAGVLSAKACLRSGVGLLTCQIPRSNYEIIQTSVPEAMTIVDEAALDLQTLHKFDKYSCIGIGPGIGTSKETAQLLKGLIHSANIPVVFDADALNILSENKTWLSFLPANSVLTPHPKEFERLFGTTHNDYERIELLRISAIKNRVTIVLKGHHTITAATNGNCYFNSTGNAGMATGGSGDVLTGVITSLIAQGVGTLDACIEGVYLHGLAGDLALENQSQESLVAGDIVENLGNAFNMIRMS